MKKILVLLGIFGFLILAGTSLQTITKNSSMSKIKEKEQPSEVGQVSDRGYQEFSQTIFDELNGKRRVFFFYANWCPTCLSADKDLREKMNEIPRDAVVLRINYNDTDTNQVEKDLAKKYEVTYQHTYVQVDAQGNKIHSWNGGQLKELLSNLVFP